MANRQGVKNRVEKDNGKLKGAAQFYEVESTNTDDETAITTANSNGNSTKNNTKRNTKRSTKPSNNTNTVIIKEKVKYVDTKTQRAYWFDNDLIEVFAREYPKERFDNSAIMNQLLRNFLVENGKI